MPIRSPVGGCDGEQRGRAPAVARTSATFCSAIARSNETNASGALESSQREGIRAALKRAGQAVGDQADRRRDDPGASASAGSAPGVPRCGESTQLRR